MLQTTKYNLSQWEKTDRILMEDFNSDNAKIDAALDRAAAKETALESRLDTLAADTKTRLLRTVTTSADAAEVNVPLAGMDWNGWSAVHILVWPKLRNGTSTMVGYELGGSTVNYANAFAHLVLYPMYAASGKVSGLFLSDKNSGAFCCFSLYSQVTALNLICRESGQPPDILSGTKVQVWGVK